MAELEVPAKTSEAEADSQKGPKITILPPDMRQENEDEVFCKKLWNTRYLHGIAITTAPDHNSDRPDLLALNIGTTLPKNKIYE